MGGMLMVSLLVTVILLVLEGNIWDALPLHLCSLSALAALGTAFGVRGMALDFLWYLGMPCALLALIFPAPAISRWQGLLNSSYAATHALIVLIPAFLIKRGCWPRRGYAPQVIMLLCAVALPTYWINRALGTDFMFLMAPPAGTPLESMFRLGAFAYYASLCALVLAVCTVMNGLLAALMKKKVTKSS